jgi:hypothetical protein
LDGNFLLPFIYDYAGACNAINLVLYDGPRGQIANEPRPHISEVYEAFAWRIHIKAINNLWDYNEIFYYYPKGCG